MSPKHKNILNKVRLKMDSFIKPSSWFVKFSLVFILWIAHDLTSFFDGGIQQNAMGSVNTIKDGELKHQLSQVAKTTLDAKQFIKKFQSPDNFNHPVINQGSISILTNLPNLENIELEERKKPAKIAKLTPIRKKYNKKPYKIMGNGRYSKMQLANFLIKNNPKVTKHRAIEMAELYIRESAFEGVNHDIAFIQMCHETGFLRFDGTVSVKQNNFCGLGTVNDYTPGESFPTIETGIKAHIQHLKAYASHKKLNGKLVDDRFRFVKRGSATHMTDLTGKWAADKQYGVKLKGLMVRISSAGK
jgi:hypothetical protein